MYFGVAHYDQQIAKEIRKNEGPGRDLTGVRSEP